MVNSLASSSRWAKLVEITLGQSSAVLHQATAPLCVAACLSVSFSYFIFLSF